MIFVEENLGSARANGWFLVRQYHISSSLQIIYRHCISYFSVAVKKKNTITKAM